MLIPYLRGKRRPPVLIALDTQAFPKGELVKQLVETEVRQINGWFSLVTDFLAETGDPEALEKQHTPWSSWAIDLVGRAGLGGIPDLLDALIPMLTCDSHSRQAARVLLAMESLRIDRDLPRWRLLFDRQQAVLVPDDHFAADDIIYGLEYLFAADAARAMGIHLLVGDRPVSI